MPRTDENVREILEAALESLAAIEHDRWAHWQKYLHSKCTRTEDGTLTIPDSFVKQWERQIATDYTDLSESEKESDREQVRKYFPIIVSAFSDSD